MLKMNQNFNDIYLKYVTLEKYSHVSILKEDQESAKNNGF